MTADPASTAGGVLTVDLDALADLLAGFAVRADEHAPFSVDV